MDIQFNPTDKITVDVPLFIRLLEYAREDAKTDMDLHKITENILALSKTGKLLTMDQYDGIVRDSDNTDRPSVNDQINNAKLQSPQEPINEIKMKQNINEIKRMQQLAGIIIEAEITKDIESELEKAGFGFDDGILGGVGSGGGGYYDRISDRISGFNGDKFNEDELNKWYDNFSKESFNSSTFSKEDLEENEYDEAIISQIQPGIYKVGETAYGGLLK